MDRYSPAEPPADDDVQSASRMMDEDSLAAEQPPKPGGWVVDNVSLKQAKNGGWIVSCSKHEQTPPNAKNPGRYESADYTFASLAEAVPFIEQEFAGSAGQSTGSAVMAAPTSGMMR